MMQSFSWKRKRKQNLHQLPAFTASNEDDDVDLDPSIDWLTATKKPKILLLEDGKIKAQRLKDEGTKLAENDRFWEAIKKWDAALSFTPDDHLIHDMLSQAYMQVGEVYPAVTASLETTRLAPQWWCGHQTLGRAHLGLGEVKLAIKSFSRAIHLQPDREELWKEDLYWAQSLLEKHRQLEEEIQKDDSKMESSVTEGLTLEEVPLNFSFEEEKPKEDKKLKKRKYEGYFTDRRFTKPTSSLEASGKTAPTARKDIDLQHFICLRE